MTEPNRDLSAPEDVVTDNLADNYTPEPDDDAPDNLGPDDEA